MLGVTFCPKEVTQLGHSGECCSCSVVVRARRERDLDVSRRRGFSFLMLQRSTKRYVLLCAIGAAVSAVCVARFSPGLSWDNAEAAGFFALIGLAAQALAHRLPKGVSGSIGFIPFMSALLVAPSLPLVCAVGLAVLA